MSKKIEERNYNFQKLPNAESIKLQRDQNEIELRKKK